MPGTFFQTPRLKFNFTTSQAVRPVRERRDTEGRRDDQQGADAEDGGGQLGADQAAERGRL